MGDEGNDDVENYESLRYLSPSHIKNKFNNDEIETETSILQMQVEKDVDKCIQMLRENIELDPTLPVLFKSQHLQFLKKGIHILPSTLEPLDASRAWLCYWILHSFELLNEPLPEQTKSEFMEFLKRCQHPDGGFGGGPGQEPHLAPTYAAVCALCMLRNEEALEIINRENLLRFLLKVKNPDGSFRMHEDSEADIRGVYCALSVAMLTSVWCKPLVKNTAHWISRCQTYEGGFGGVPGMEAHGGYTFCGLSSLVLLKEGHLININNLLRWLVNKQAGYEGGFQGRTNKLIDSCYSFWQGVCFPLIHKILSKTVPENLSDDSWLFNQRALQEYILICCQDPHGGLMDKQRRMIDFYHTCYSLSGLSVAQHFHSGQQGNDCIIGSYENELVHVHPIYNICVPSAMKAIQYFQNLSFPTLPEGLPSDE